MTDRRPARRRPDRPAEDRYSIESRLIYGRNQSARWDFGRHVIPPISASTNFRFRSVAEGAAAFGDFAARAGGDDRREFRYIYDRLDEPNKDLLEEHLAIADEGAVALVFATGMAAISALLSVLLNPGDEILVHMPVYGCTNDLLRKHFAARLGFPVRCADLSAPGALASGLTAATRVVYCESPANPTCRLLDIAAIARRLADHNRGRDRPARLVVDNTFASPFCQRPLTLGADFACYSLTKSIGGFGTVMGGSVVAGKDDLATVGQLIQLRKDTGGALSPTNAWHILVYGISTLPLRMRRMQENALVLARFLEAHPRVRMVSYPGLDSHPQREIAQRQMVDYAGNFAPGNMLYFEPAGPDPASRCATASRWMDRVAHDAYTITLAVSLGQIRTLIEHPGAMTHAVCEQADQATGQIDAGGIRLSVGIENPEDLLRDLGKALV
jgi:cystathionine beta-lyase/cystathionine gamma-synthase